MNIFLWECEKAAIGWNVIELGVFSECKYVEKGIQCAVNE